MPEERETLVEVCRLKKYFPVRGGVLKRPTGYVKAVDDVSFSVYKGETLGIVGESGSGKSTMARTLLRLIEPTEGNILFDGEDLVGMTKSELRAARKNMQMVFQDPFSSLNPRFKVSKIIEEPLVAQGNFSKAERREKVVSLLKKVGLGADALDKFPHEFSGGQRQRIGIARALAMNPKFIIGDEPVSALDVSVQAQVLNLMKDLQDEFGLTYLFIAHDLSVVKHISDRVGVMYLGRLVEIGPKKAIYEEPLHPYTRALLSAVPSTNVDAKRERIVLKGEPPNPANPPTGCPFHTRCPLAHERCMVERPELVDQGNGHYVACHLYE
ncbi:ABC transporter ATP-binding protein [Ornithinibacillus halotolerans]|uniref:Oligopeptide transport ATP-binding protein AppF n=1 Tax=Ornithinibacillus halotolerans TaxID=1274357 RepID=A0A916RS71_9BACI|nr:dipeptide ABC transporter ATP-binding protein [Ornithinibacillus halotolerans]GGA64995.1 oligopeptide transport ATP-binding protein AppF [Ornithinibacillus halotolerans]